jgi:CubicO group peptidase (beta-lactamase class C family)
VIEDKRQFNLTFKNPRFIQGIFSEVEKKPTLFIWNLFCKFPFNSNAMRLTVLVPLLLLSAFFSGSIQGQSLYFPPQTGTWDSRNPSDLGWCQENIDSLYAYLGANNSKGFVLLDKGKIVLESYFGNFTKDSLWYWASAGKTLTAMLLGIAQQEGHLSLSDSSSQYLGAGWTSAPASKERLITVRNQLALDAGLDDGVANKDCTVDTCLQYLSDAGTRWAYHNAVYTLLDSVLYYATGQNANSYFQSRIRPATGMAGLFFGIGFNNVFFSTPRSMARFGLLMLNRGTWNGTPVLSDTAFFGQMIRPSQAQNRSYGYLTWLNGQSSFMLPGLQLAIPGPLFPEAPSDMFAAQGRDGQILSVVPSTGLVWVRMGESPNSGNGDVTPVFTNNVWRYINRLPCSSGISTHANAPAFLWPNPGQNRIQYQGKGEPSFWRIYDALGRLWSEGPAKREWNPGALPNGLYQIEIQLGDQRQRFPWVRSDSH